MSQWDAMGFLQQGLQGFIPVARLREDPDQVPAAPGVYLVLRETTDPPQFLESSPASWFKGRPPTVPVDRLRAEWVEGTTLLYVGSGDDLRRRVGQLVEFSQAGPSRSIGHWGGRLLWQVKGSQGFLIAWKVTAATCYRTTERDLVDEFTGTFGRMPFANLQRPPGCR